MITIKDKIDFEIEWVIKEITKLKLIPHRHSLSEEESVIYFKSIVPMLYAYLEGFIKKSFKIYIEFVNEKNLGYNEISNKLLVHKFEKKYNCFMEKIENIDKKVNLINNIIKDINNMDIKIFFNDKKIQNINCDRLNKLFNEMNFKSINNKKINDGLNKLLQYRNGIAHGENSYKVTEELVMEFIDIIVSTMDEVSDIIVEGYNQENYLKNEEV